MRYYDLSDPEIWVIYVNLQEEGASEVLQYFIGSKNVVIRYKSPEYVEEVEAFNASSFGVSFLIQDADPKLIAGEQPVPVDQRNSFNSLSHKVIR